MENNLEIAKRRLKVMKLQDALNDLLHQHRGAMTLYATVRDQIPDFANGIQEHPQFEDFKDITLGEILEIWGDICNMFSWKLKDAIKIIEAKICEMEKPPEKGTITRPKAPE